MLLGLVSWSETYTASCILELLKIVRYVNNAGVSLANLQVLVRCFCITSAGYKLYTETCENLMFKMFAIVFIAARSKILQFHVGLSNAPAGKDIAKVSFVIILAQETEFKVTLHKLHCLHCIIVSIIRIHSLTFSGSSQQ